ncbi:polyribonucleotide nucleotidyltransferase [Bacteroidota bacterium]
MTSQSFEREIGGRRLVIETGKLAGQANGAVTVSYGDSVVLVTACTDKKPREGIDFLPLTIEYEERLYAAGKIPGGFIRREGRPTQEATLAARLTDRPLRPLLPKTWRNELQVIITVLSADLENATDILAVIGSSAALSISEIPFYGPVSALRVGYIDGELLLNPTLVQMDTSLLDLIVVSKGDEIIMVEAGAKEVPEDIVNQAMRFGHEANQAILAMQEELRQACGKPKLEAPVSEVNEELAARVSSMVDGKLAQPLSLTLKAERQQALDVIEKEIIESLGDSFPDADIPAAFDARIKKEARANVLEKGQRIGGRSLTEVRTIGCEVGLLPRTHGSGMFVRGQTQVLTIATLGSVGKAQKLDGLGLDEPKYFIHHYNFPPYSSGEVKRVGSVGRREIGHGALAEKALIAVLPSEEEFPYTIRLVSEVLSSSGSTSMASACASSLSLMDAGVPIKRAVAGIAMGLVTDDQGNYAILTDIEGIEDAYGDMDFKVAGTSEGITALQMDTKLKGLSLEIMEKAVHQAKDARLFILDRMQQTINTNRSELSPFAPRVYLITIDQDKIGAVIGSGGKTIRSIIAETKASVDIEDDGTVRIGSANEEDAQKAIKMIENLTKEVEIGEVYTGKVVRLMNFGAFIEILPGKDGLVHISELADHHVGRVEDEVNVGDEVTVRVINIDNMGRINLSRRSASEDATQGPKRQDSPAPNRRFNQRDEGPSRPFRNKRF